jgi:peroxiredoxin
VLAVREHLGALGDTVPIVVTFTHDPARQAAYGPHLGVDFPVLADPDRSLYRLLGAGRGSFRRVWSPATLAMYARLIRRGRRLRVPTDDTRQLGADALIDRDGRLARLWLPEGPDARPAVDEMIAAVRALDGE